MSILVTMPGKYGDILWTLPTLRELAKRGDTVDLMVMKDFCDICPLINEQPYIMRCFFSESWRMVDDHCGARPNRPPSIPDGYDEVIHLGYKDRPDIPLIDLAAREAKIDLTFPVLPFLQSTHFAIINLVSYSFNQMHTAIKAQALDVLERHFPNLQFRDVSKDLFQTAAAFIDASLFYFGDRSSNWVIANGLNKKILTVEPEPGRREYIFSCPYGTEAMPNPDDFSTMIEMVEKFSGRKPCAS